MATGVLKISDAATLAIHAMVILAKHEGTSPIPVAAVAEGIGVSEAHMGKVFQRLARVGLVNSRRGPGGGFTLGKQSADIRLMEIFEAIDGPMAQGACLLGRAQCAVEGCVMGSLLHDLQVMVHDYFQDTRLSAVIDDGKAHNHAHP